MPRMVEHKRLPARLFESQSGRVPVREWLLAMEAEDRKTIGEDICTAEFGWPVGIPLCRALKGHIGLWEIRSNLSGGRISRVFFCIHDGAMVLLHGFIKKSQKTPTRELETANQRMRGLK